MFIGEFKHSVDSKGRFAVPVKFRKRLQKGAVVTRGLDGCLFLYPAAEWKILAEKLANLPIAQANTRAFSRLMLAGAMELEIDRQGRAVIPEYLRRYAAIGKKVIVAGLYNRLEIWASDRWEVYRKNTEEKGDDIAEKLGELNV